MKNITQHLKRTLSLKLLGGILVLSGCQSIDITPGPDLTATFQIYEQPSGSLANDGLDLVMERAKLRLVEVQELGKIDFIIDTLVDVGGNIADVAGEDGSQAVLLSGVSDVVTICPGLDDAEQPDIKNGQSDFKITFENSFLTPSIWGNFAECIVATQVAGLNQSDVETSLLNLDFTLFLGEAIPLWNLDIDLVLIRVDGNQKAFGKTRNIAVDFRVDSDELLEIRVPAEGGDVIFDFGTSFTQAAVRTRDGSFCCYFEEKVCSAAIDEVCAPKPGDIQLQW